MSSRVGIDLVSTSSVTAALSAHGQRYLDRAYTDGEVADCSAGGTVDVQRLAARFAAKEAVKKVLRSDGIPWRSIEVVRHVDGWTGVALAGAAAEHADAQRIGEIALSLTHEGDVAVAVAVAEVAA